MQLLPVLILLQHLVKILQFDNGVFFPEASHRESDDDDDDDNEEVEDTTQRNGAWLLGRIQNQSLDIDMALVKIEVEEDGDGDSKCSAVELFASMLKSASDRREVVVLEDDDDILCDTPHNLIEIKRGLAPEVKVSAPPADWVPNRIKLCTAFAVQSTFHTPLQNTPGQLVFGCDMILNVKHEANWEYISAQEQNIILKNTEAEKAKRISHTYNVGDKVLTKRGTENKCKTPYQGPYTSTQVNENGTVQMMIKNVEDTINIRRLTSYLDTDNIPHGGECSSMRNSRVRRANQD
jgi:hypothetical protein